MLEHSRPKGSKCIALRMHLAEPADQTAKEGKFGFEVGAVCERSAQVIVGLSWLFTGFWITITWVL